MATKAQLAALARGRAKRAANLARRGGGKKGAAARRSKKKAERRTKLTKAQLKEMRLRNLAKARAARASGKRFKGKTKVRGKIGASRKGGTVIGVVQRKPGMLYYVTGNGSLVEKGCRNGGCRKNNSARKVVGVKKGKRLTARQDRVYVRKTA